MNLLSSASVFSFYTLLSRVLGYLRDILIAVFLGTSIYADAFFVAFRLPNTFRRLFAEGTFNAAFIPSYAEEKLKGKKKSKKFADDVFNLLLLFLILLIIMETNNKMSFHYLLTVCLIFLYGRCAHAICFAFFDYNPFLRISGMICTYISLLVFAIVLIFSFF